MADESYETPNPLLQDRPADLKDVDVKPTIIRAGDPKLPIDFQGEINAVVSFIVTREGRPIGPHIDKTNHPEYNPLVLSFVNTFEFNPAQYDGESVAVRVTLPVNLSN
ncbi:energy transducer TonB [Pelagicoccus sp. SDUM812005]|uniref:energy transducer TonB family protein n=1 Tax=Pelagicoccus sp. SDUM812005 TaxID=3041257 RepID=UPI0028128863|nr:energy transducer TonB [Pelagicoccus sp. SDUM812005]